MVISLDLVAGILGFLFTLLIFSYVLGDNPLFRIAVYIFVGVSSGYIAAVAWWQIIMPRLVYPLMSAIASGTLLDLGLILVPALGALLILMKASSRLADLGRVVMAFIVGAGASVTIAGALMGTLIPQVLGTINAFDLNAASARNIGLVEAITNGAVILTGTILTLSYFHFGARPKADGSTRRTWLVEALAWGGRIFIGVALGAVFAGVYAAALTALIELISSLINFIISFLGNFQ
jgi:hypothetical protein